MVLDSANEEQRVNTERTIKRYLEDEWSAKQPLKKIKLVFQDVRYPRTPQQPNNTDCGVYVMKTFEEFLKDYPSKESTWQNWRPFYRQANVVELRKRIKFLIQKLTFESRT